MSHVINTCLESGNAPVDIREEPQRSQRKNTEFTFIEIHDKFCPEFIEPDYFFCYTQ